ncbi:UDP-2,4-diacetamido-2,4,6-trideoxy-beta-L-altropyranose hydrolase [Pelosinus fermentans]|uniref:UDP-2,4-diacetamido-2,4, 6-trideoxy-beta-L-altropyranose hydrolase n=1 Tax=Pelosinus fermentans TaxID=365349 RepID=UPI0002685FAA|nr:UDP-2,4-diacetamido-2,4,6-trideoxy-beta-L-altropyranose hydrolase [Pelosinus fermentans]OAM92876.1 pseudaminic acid biosynthesis-associated protein PseG [Pelosinus fermentans DSM 17108]SDQ59659.1 UDP-2,4-diacetamido-2,4,6-trideoxy-beta-L-altropyranose hydrolase [Pelosinus fermentans]
MVRIAIRADGGKGVGLGHIMRCLSLAKAFRKVGHLVYFLTKYNMGISLIEKEKFEVIRIPSEEKEREGFFYGNSEQLVSEAQVILKLLHQYKIDILIIDSYNITNQYFLTLKSYVSCLVYIDDENKSTYPVDVVINGNITAAYLGYRKYNNNQVLLLGPQYNMIRDEFKNISPRGIRENVEEIMITTGGSDPYHMTEKLLNTFLNNDYFSKVRFNVLVGSGFTTSQDLIHLSQDHERVVLYSNAIADTPGLMRYSTISEMMLRSDIALSTGGSTLYEFAACGVPVVAFIVAENQRFLVEKMEHLGYIINLGWHNQICEEQIVDRTRRLMNDYAARAKMSSKCLELVDSLGTERIVKELTREFVSS